MNNFDLPKIAHNICAIANCKLSRTHINITHKWILTDEEDGRKNMTLSPVELINDAINDAIFYAIYSLKDDSSYTRFREYIENIESIQNMLSYYGDYYGWHWTVKEG